MNSDLLAMNYSSKCFGRLCPHHQEVGLRFTAYVFCPVLAVVMSDRQHPLHSAHILPPDSPAPQQLKQDRNHTQWNAVRHPDDGRKDARNMV